MLSKSYVRTLWRTFTYQRQWRLNAKWMACMHVDRSSKQSLKKFLLWWRSLRPSSAPSHSPLVQPHRLRHNSWVRQDYVTSSIYPLCHDKKNCFISELNHEKVKPSLSSLRKSHSLEDTTFCCLQAVDRFISLGAYTMRARKATLTWWRGTMKEN